MPESPEPPQSPLPPEDKREPTSDERRKKNEKIARQALKWSELVLSMIRDGEDPASVSIDELLRRCVEKLGKDSKGILDFGKFLEKSKFENAAAVLMIFQVIFTSKSKMLERDRTLRDQVNRATILIRDTLVMKDGEPEKTEK